MKHKHLSQAYNIYKNDMGTINIITDNDYISISEFTHLLNTILSVDCIEPLYINNFLLKIKAISKSQKNSYNKYVANPEVLKYCKEIHHSNGCFYIWNAKFLFFMFGINISKPITKNSINKLNNTLQKYVFIKLNTYIIYNNLKMLQLIFNQYIF